MRIVFDHFTIDKHTQEREKYGQVTNWVHMGHCGDDKLAGSSGTGTINLRQSMDKLLDFVLRGSNEVYEESIIWGVELIFKHFFCSIYLFTKKSIEMSEYREKNKHILMVRVSDM